MGEGLGVAWVVAWWEGVGNWDFSWESGCNAEDIKTFMPILHKSGRTAETRCGTDSSGHRAGVEEIREIG